MKRLRRLAILGLAAVAAVLVTTGSSVHAANARTSPRSAWRLDAKLRGVVTGGAPVGLQRVIVRVRPGSRSAVRQSLTALHRSILAEHDSLNAITAVVGAEDLSSLANRGDVLSVSADAVVHPHSLLGGTLGLANGLLKVVGQVLLPNGADTSGPAVPPAVLRATLGVASSQWTGRGIGVAIIDSGLEMSAEFQGRVTAFYDFTKGGVASSPYDDYGHGTHVAGTIAGSGALSRNRDYRGLAPNTKLIILKVLDGTGAGYSSDVIRAIDFAVDNRAALGVDVINLSLGHPIFEPASSDPLVQAVERASRAGVIVVAAAGNYGKNETTGRTGYAGITSPGNAPSAITVGAVRTEDTVTRDDDRIPDYSSAGPTWYDAFVKPDLIAPGHNIIATAAKRGALYQTYPQLKADDSDYMRLSGTSMATAVTTGSIALLLEANRAANGYPAHPSLTPNAVKAILQYTAVGIHNDAGIEYDALRKGAGSLNTKGAIDLAKTVDTSTGRGHYWLTTPPTPWTYINGEYLTWNQAVVWGDAIIWGSTTSVNETAWGSAIIWGSNTAWSSAIIWGSSIVWTDSQSWADAIIWGSDAVGYDYGSAIIWGSHAGLNADTIAWQDLSENQAAASGSLGQ